MTGQPHKTANKGSETAMNSFGARWIALPLLGLSVLMSGAEAQTPGAQLETTRAKNEAATPAIAPVAKDRLFGVIPVSTKSDAARQLVEIALEKYENYQLDEAVAFAHRATVEDPHFALAYAVWSFAGRLDQPSLEALHKAQSLAPKGTADEQLMVRWMTGVQENDAVPAIAAMNDLLARYPKQKHVLYLMAEWTYGQGDYDRAQDLAESVLAIDPNFAPVMNLLGYAYIQCKSPNPQKALEMLHRYAVLEPRLANPQDSLGEVSRMAGDDKDALQHYSASLKIIPNYISSQTGLGDTYVLMGNAARARQEYDKSLRMATNGRDALHVEYQKALSNFWEGNPTTGLTALDALAIKAKQKKEPYAKFEIGFGRALLMTDATQQLRAFGELEGWLQKPQEGMTERDRNASLAATLREQIRIAGALHNPDVVGGSIRELEELASRTRDAVVANCYESARGFAFFANGDYATAVSGLSADPHAPLVLKAYVEAQEKLGKTENAEEARNRMKYLRAPTAEWYLVSRAEKKQTAAK
jgi:tetratricopeptide (TPR) repeat protein